MPSNAHVHYLRRLSPLESTYTKERAVEICLATTLALGFDMTAIPNIRLDLEDRPQKNPRACVIPSNPPEVVHLITRAQGGLSDYQAFMHEAGHALHYAGVDPRLPYTFRSISRDHALTEIYSYIFEAVTREPGWHALHFGLSDAQAEENAQATLFLEALLYRRYTAKLRYELGFWSAFAEERGSSERDYSTLLTEATGIRYDPRNYLADMDAGFYSADYLRAWIRVGAAAHVPAARGRRRLVAERADGRDPARPLPRGHAADERGGRRRGSASTRSTPGRSSRISPRPSSRCRCFVSSAWISRVSFATSSVSSLSCCVSAVFDWSSVDELLGLASSPPPRAPVWRLSIMLAVQLVAVGLTRLREQDQRRGVRGLRREDQIQQDERVRGPSGDERDRVERDPERRRRSSGR